MQKHPPGKEADLPDEHVQTAANQQPEHRDETKGAPTGDRHAAETLAGRLAKHRPPELKTK